jgi:hypothetical protein
MKAPSSPGGGSLLEDHFEDRGNDSHRNDVCVLLGAR